MELTLEKNHFFEEGQDVQTLQIDKFATLIGENGSGKSTILQSIFQSRVSKSEEEHGRLICFTSGQNESFSDLFSGRLDAIRKRNDNKDIDYGCLYFTKADVRYLVFLASTFVSEGRTRAFLKDHGYIGIENGMVTGAIISLELSIPKNYLKRVKDDEEAEAKDYDHPSIRRRPFNMRLERFIDHSIELSTFDDILDKGDGITNRRISMASSQVFTLFDGAKDEATKFFIEGSYNAYFFDSSSVRLTFNDGLEFQALSDGEYQLLFLYAILDLFDSENSLFLLDEADSHLHFTNISKLWETIKAVNGAIITTTHLLDSISAAGIDNIQVVSQGRLVEEDKFAELVGRLNQLGFVQKTQFKACSLIENIVLMDHADDWAIFMALAKKKLGTLDERLKKIQVISLSCGRNAHTQQFGMEKRRWVEAYANRSVEWSLQTKNVFLICDRDTLPLASINTTNKVSVNGENPQPTVWSGRNDPKVHLLSWRHLEIENYLLSYSALSANEKSDIEAVNKELSATNQLRPNSSPDNNHVRDLDAKDYILPIIKPVQGLCLNSLKAYVDLMPPEEISEDIENMYRYIVSQL